MAKKKISKGKNEKPSKKLQSNVDVSAPHFLIVGIGASAGGLEAFKQFFEQMPADTGMAFVIVQHLDPTHKSILSDLLRNYTKMKVMEVRDNTKVIPNNIYTIPPNKEMGIMNGVLHLMEPTVARGHRRTIDYFMRSLAEDQKEKAVGVILSGTGTEGALGLKAIKGEGGLTLVQEPDSAKYDGMPRSAIASKAADIILTTEKMPDHLIKYMRKRKIRPITTQREEQPKQNILDKIFMVLRDRTGNNFSYYKLSTINRRIDKRMAINQIDTLENYLKYLKNTHKESDLLFKELLIGVTAFFRDKVAFQALAKQAIKKIIESKTMKDSIRIWVPGCSTGEEAYTIAILFEEVLRKQKKKISVQIFASDIDEEAIDTARSGVYPESITADVDSKILHQYFTLENHFWKVKKELRDKVIFAVQNLISDPPFSKLDLISCRNLLIYLNAESQQRVFPIFHYSLIPKGFLFLGTSETIGQHSNLFSPIDQKNKIFARKTALTKHRPHLDFSKTQYDTGLMVKIKGDLPLTLRPQGIRLAELTERMLLHSYAPGCVIINEKYNALYFSGDTGKYLQPTPGEASLNILDMARSGLKTHLRTAINRVRKNKKDVERPGIQVKTNGNYQTINLKVKSISQSETEEQLIMVIFEDVKETVPVSIALAGNEELENPRFIELEHELVSTKEYLRTTIEELEISNEELKSSNEELQSANEELQSTNEELETSKEELQSVNEEMITVNTELQNKIYELAHAHDDMSNLLASTEIGTIFLGKELEIKRFTPSINKVLNLIQTDIGRPISDLSFNIYYYSLQEDAQNVLDSLITKKVIVQSKNKNWYHMQITPYRTIDNVIDGVVITFVDISEEKKMEEELIKVNNHLNLAMKALPAVPFTCHRTKSIEFVFIGDSVKEVLGFMPDNFTSDTSFWSNRIHPKDKKEVLNKMLNYNEEAFISFEFRWKCAEGKYKKLRSQVSVIESQEGRNNNVLVGIWQEVL